MLAAKEVDALEMCTSAKTRRTCVTSFDQLEILRTKITAARRELDEIYSMQEFHSQLPDKLDEILNTEHICPLAKIKCNDDPVFNGDSYSEVKQWINKQTSEPQETHVPISDGSKYIIIRKLCFFNFYSYFFFQSFSFVFLKIIHKNFLSSLLYVYYNYYMYICRIY